MSKFALVFAALACVSSFSSLASAADGCSIAQVMKEVHAKAAYTKYEYASNYAGEQGAPTQKRNEITDQYLFWVDSNGTTCPAVVTFESGRCSAGAAVVKENACQ